MKNFSSNSEDNPSCQHNRKGILVPSEPKDGMPKHTEGSSDDHDPSGSDPIDHDAPKQRDNNIREGIQSIEQVELKL